MSVEDISFILHELAGVTGRDGIRFSPIGGLMTRMTNDTGATSVPGQIVAASASIDNGYKITEGSDVHPIGVVYNAVADGEEGWIVILGIADVLLKDNTKSTHSYWVYTSTEAGYADATLADPPGGGIPELDTHMREIGHCTQSVAAGGGGTHVTCRITLHFN